jgi:predicted alpha/beta superfamily hydrolase
MKFWHWAVGILAPTLLGCAQAQVPVEQAPAHETFTLASRHTNETRVVNVYLPPGYAPEGQGAYPTLYMPDGGLKEDFPHLATALDAGIRAGQVRPMLLVGIENTERRRDMTGPTQVASDRDIAPRVGGSAAFRAFIAEELIPAIEARYRVDESRGIIGESAAGLFIVETLFLQPGLFDTHIAFSPSLWWNDARLVRDARARMAAEPKLRGRLFLASADEENIVPHVAALAEVLASAAPEGLYWTVRPRPDLRHDNIYRTLAPELLAGYYGAVTAQDAAAGPVRREGEPTVETE